MIVLFFYTWYTSRVCAKIVWHQDLVCDPNTNTGPLASCINNNGNGIFVITKTESRGTFLDKEGECILWEIKVGGDIVRRVLLRDANGNTIQTNAQDVGPGCAMASDRSGNIVTAGVLGEQRGKRSIDVISKTDINTADPNIISGNRIDHFSIKEMVFIKKATFALVGARKDDGFYLRIDKRGKILNEVSFDMGQTEILSGAATLKPDNTNLAIAGLSGRNPNNESKENSVDNFILIYDPNDTLLQEDYFIGAFPGITFPKVCCLDNGNLVVGFYNKDKKESKSGLWARCYTQKLEFLWEKELFSIENSSFSFDIISCGSIGFRIAILNPIKGLKIYTFNENGDLIGSIEYRGMVVNPGFNLMRVGGKTIAVFEEGSPGRIEEVTIKAKVIALD
jgi:hypothetical protein